MGQDLQPGEYETATQPCLRDENSRIKAILALQLDLAAERLNLEDAMHLIANTSLALTQGEGASIELSDGDSLVSRMATGTLAPHKGVRYAAAGTLAGQCLSSGEIVVCDDAETDPRADNGRCLALRIKSFVLVPLKQGQTVVGVVKITSSRSQAFDDDRDALQLMAIFVGSALLRASAGEENRAMATQQIVNAKMLEEQTALLRAFFETSSFLIAIIARENNDIRYLSVNQPMAGLLSREPQEMVGKTARQLGIPDHVIQLLISKSQLAEQENKSVTFEFDRSLDTTTLTIKVTLCPLPRTPNLPPTFSCLSEDVTEAVNLRRRVDVAERMASIGRLAAGVAHEANNPLSYVIANLNFIQQELAHHAHFLPESHASELQDVLQETAEGALRVKNIVRDLYSFSRTESHPLGVLNLNEEIERVLRMTSLAVKDTAVLVKDLGAVPLLKGNQARMGQVFFNLIINAAHAIGAGRSNQNVIRISSRPLEDGGAAVEVSDTGPGIRSEDLAKIFDPFFTTKTVGQGMGLGLSICHSIVKEHGGELTATSEVGKGAVFTVRLPPPEGL